MNSTSFEAWKYPVFVTVESIDPKTVDDVQVLDVYLLNSWPSGATISRSDPELRDYDLIRFRAHFFRIV